ncbi:MAG: hypothetical protein A3B08_01060 [Candidatus Taylorbacteria bacterium RIFCSPLOWO2_01_FULL_43_44]|uniref:Uncharacterized protein n=1 Tax=Candidatus Taylorbacteria bacterium RIFCSPHIGHO2_02_FULL_43_32b TaxID=1802306 RepID=A0A1G2MLM3_9BACT|nr:MAG: hypothetical protein A3C72_03185 [Candidatus Taylorbacteria bacterium RIFCSPHIGHO2_02_FULL_43_32b]OHA31851.1 MAG: hypothetical protein A3B08_01060 [Candidatus Taylorbacteria bacterium RIFCSPLOWO2_01_FULL_43_44]
MFVLSGGPIVGVESHVGSKLLCRLPGVRIVVLDYRPGFPVATDQEPAYQDAPPLTNFFHGGILRLMVYG